MVNARYSDAQYLVSAFRLAAVRGEAIGMGSRDSGVCLAFIGRGAVTAVSPAGVRGVASDGVLWCVTVGSRLAVTSRKRRQRGVGAMAGCRVMTVAPSSSRRRSCGSG
jgi:hypothetical protein